MQRREFIKQAVATAALAEIAPQLMGDMSDTERSYSSPTISVRLAKEVDRPDFTAVYLTEHEDADQVIIEAFYWATDRLGGAEQRLMHHKEATAPLVKGVTVAANLMMPIASIVFIRVKEMKLLNQSEFGDVPHGRG
jgi:hypothetical protein